MARAFVTVKRQQAKYCNSLHRVLHALSAVTSAGLYASLRRYVIPEAARDWLFREVESGLPTARPHDSFQGTARWSGAGKHGVRKASIFGRQGVNGGIHEDLAIAARPHPLVPLDTIRYQAVQPGERFAMHRERNVHPVAGSALDLLIFIDAPAARRRQVHP